MYSLRFSIQGKYSIQIFLIGVLTILVAGLMGCENSSGVEEEDTEPVSDLEPTIESIEPTSGMVGTEVLIVGSNFGQNLEEVSVNFNGTQAVLSSLSPEEIETTVPEGASTGPVNVIIAGEEASGPTFTVEEPKPTTGSLIVTIETSGEEIDEDGYIVSLDSGSEFTTAVNDTVTIENLNEGTFQLTLSEVADNCDVENENPKSVSITAGDTSNANFSVICEAPNTNTLDIPLNNKIVGVSYSSDFRNRVLAAINPDGTEKVILTDAREDLLAPDISPDGQSVLFWGASGIHKLSSSGEEVLASGSEPSWSPDGTQIAYLVGDDMYTMNADGSNQVQITSEENTNEVESPAWSPNGERIIFRCDQGFGNGANQLCIVNSDGTNLTVLTNNEYTYRAPAWSPDGTKIAFHGYFDDNSGIKESRIFVMNADGSNVVQVTEDLSIHPTWSPDGTKIAFVGNLNGDRDAEDTSSLYSINIDGTDKQPFPGHIIAIRPNNSNTTPVGNGGPDWGPGNQ
ncbi:MAG: IPT/TIG domain-containing protein [Gracilimonas sp.]|nr:IPT/TIG domain-containing protein [Gracilimonas sp.]